jgi:NAD(P)-dependent dehydrogenase (short-subunit alcohol dehydrogenase family)
MRLQGKVAIITGAGSGIGRATALLFAREGARVVVADYAAEGGEETVRLIKEAGGEATFVKVDVSKAADAQKMVQAAIDSYGKLDILYNNAGIEGPWAPTEDVAEEDWDRVLSINLKGVFLGSKYAIPEMLKQGGGVIINTASVAGLIAVTNMPAYCASKGGVVLLTKAMALENAAKRIRINCICPGAIRTPMFGRLTLDKVATEKAFCDGHPIGRCGTPEEIAYPALYLASDESSFITGTALVVDGGWTAQ